MKVLFYPMLPHFRETIAFRKVVRLHPFVLLASVTCRWRWMWRKGGRGGGKRTVLCTHSSVVWGMNKVAECHPHHGKLQKIRGIWFGWKWLALVCVMSFSWRYWRKGEVGLNWLLSSFSVFGITDAECVLFLRHVWGVFGTKINKRKERSHSDDFQGHHYVTAPSFLLFISKIIIILKQHTFSISNTKHREWRQKSV